MFIYKESGAWLNWVAYYVSKLVVRVSIYNILQMCSMMLQIYTIIMGDLQHITFMS